MVDIDFITADVDGVVVDSIVDVFKVVVVDAAMVVVAFDLLDDPRGNVFNDLFEEAVVVSLDDGGSFDVVFCTFDILALVPLVDIS